MSSHVTWSGMVESAQPRIRLTRSFDERTHSYLGFMLRVVGTVDGEAGEVTVGVGKVAQAKHAFRVGDRVRGVAVPVSDPRREVVDVHRASRLRVEARAAEPPPGPPWHGGPPVLEVYRARGHRRLDARTYARSCTSCMWGCRMPVEMIVDHWNPSVRRHRFETFCYGPKSCRLYRAGAPRKVPGRHGMSYVEEDWVDDDATAHRADDD